MSVIKKALASFGVLLMLGLVAGVAAAADPVDRNTTRLWQAKCGSCHGMDGLAQTKIGREMQMKVIGTAEWQKTMTDDEIREQILDGFKETKDGVLREMKPWRDKLSDSKVDSLVAYIRALEQQ